MKVGETVDDPGYEARGCLAGTRYCRVTPEGEVVSCLPTAGF